MSIAVKGHASLGARWNARALASAASLRSARHMRMFHVRCRVCELLARVHGMLLSVRSRRKTSFSILFWRPRTGPIDDWCAMLPPSTRSPQLLSPGFSAGHCGEDPVKDRRPLDREAQRVTPEASSHCEPTSGGPCAPVRAARCWILYAPFFRARANSAWAGLRARILYRPCPGVRIQGGRSGSSTSFTSPPRPSVMNG